MQGESENPMPEFQNHRKNRLSLFLLVNYLRLDHWKDDQFEGAGSYTAITQFSPLVEHSLSHSHNRNLTIVLSYHFTSNRIAAIYFKYLVK